MRGEGVRQLLDALPALGVFAFGVFDVLVEALAARVNVFIETAVGFARLDMSKGLSLVSFMPLPPCLPCRLRALRS